MKYGMMMAGAVVLMTAGMAVAQTAPTPMPPDYQILVRKSIFSRDRVVADPRRPRPNWQNGGSSQRPRNYTPVFIGVLLEDSGEFVAYVQDPSSGNVTALHAGDSLPASAGVIKSIDLDSMSVTSADKQSKTITIGQNILGGAAEYPSAAAPAAAPTPPAARPEGPGSNAEANGGPGEKNGGENGTEAPPPSTAGGAPAAGGPTGRLPGESMLDYLKRRRAMQINK